MLIIKYHGYMTISPYLDVIMQTPDIATQYPTIILILQWLILSLVCHFLDINSSHYDVNPFGGAAGI